MPAPLVLPAPSPPAPTTTQGSTFSVNAALKRTQNKPKRFKQLNLNATAAHEQTLTCEEGNKGELGIQVKQYSVWMPRLGTCIESAAHILTLRARCALHSHHIPFIPAFTCAEHER